MAATTSSSLPPRPPAGYAPLAISPTQVLLPLTISNRCGQAFRWRANDVWERRAAKEEAKSEALSAYVKSEPGEASLQVKAEPDMKLEAGAKIEEACQTESPWERQTEWSLCLADRVVLLRQDEARSYLYHRTVLPDLIAAAATPADLQHVESVTAAWLADYLNMQVPLDALYEEWSAKDEVFKRFAKRFAGVRMLKQDPWECLCAFICSSNNNIARIGQMVQSLCTHYSEPLLSITYPPAPPDAELAFGQSQEATVVTYYPFPPAARLCGEDVEETLRKLSFGYRAGFIAKTARMLCETHTLPEPERELALPSMKDALGLKRAATADAEGASTKRKRAKKSESDVKQVESAEQASQHSPTSFLLSLRKMTYKEARVELLKFQGVGPKVADCILLMSMDQPSSIPVDRHVYQFAARWYNMRVKEGLKGYEEIAERFRVLWGDYAGWAHSVIFTADLRAFQDYQPKEEETKIEGGSVKKEEVQALAAPPAAPAVAANNDAKPIVASANTVHASTGEGSKKRTVPGLPYSSRKPSQARAGAGKASSKGKAQEAVAEPIVPESLAERVKGRKSGGR